jgi:flagellar biosynthesis/type III secretory pathway protein FliH
MAYEAETPFEKFVEETFTKENIPYIRQRIADVKKLREERARGIAEGTAKGIAEGTAKGIAEGTAKGIAEGIAKGKLEGKLEGRELTISTFLSKMPDMPDAEVARLFDVTPEYIRNLRKKL